MSLHGGSSAMAHNLDRFRLGSDFELGMSEAIRLRVLSDTLALYREWYGDEKVPVIDGEGCLRSLPAYEVAIREQVHGENFIPVRQLGLELPQPSHYEWERRGA